MFTSLKRLVAREPRHDVFAPVYSAFIRRFEACKVDVRAEGSRGRVLVTAPLGRMWVGAHFRKGKRGWVAQSLDGGGI